MKAKLFLIVLFILFLYGSWHFGRLRSSLKPSDRSVKASGQTTSFSLLSWNVGYFDYEADSRAQNSDLEHIASVINEANADVAALQEIAEPEQLGMLDELLDGQYPYQMLARGFRTDRFVAIVSKLVIREQTSIATSVGRDAAAAVLEVPNGGEVVLVNCHADAFSSRRRRFFVSDVIDWFRESGQSHVILAGDFNLDLTPVQSSDLFTDDKKNDSESYSLILENFRDLGKNAGPTGSFDRRIDYVFLSSQRMEVIAFKVLRGRLTGRMDHHPLLVQFGWK